MAIEWEQKVHELGRQVWECVIAHDEWPSGHAAKTTGTPFDIQRFSKVTAFYVNGFGVNSVDVTPTPYVYSRSAEAWKALTALTAETLADGTGISRMLKPIVQDPTNGDILGSPMGIVFSVDPTFQPNDGDVTIILECVE